MSRTANKLLLAIKWASEKMDGKKRKKNNRDYFTDHCMRLLGLVSRDPKYGDDEDAAIIIVCHDVVEDCTENDTDDEREELYAEITDLFGLWVMEGVHDLTDEFTKKRHPDKNRAKRKGLELERQKGIRDRSKCLKLYDRYINLCDLIESNDWNMTYARESWEMGFHLSDQDNFYIAIKVLERAAFIRDKAAK